MLDQVEARALPDAEDAKGSEAATASSALREDAMKSAAKTEEKPADKTADKTPEQNPSTPTPKPEPLDPNANEKRKAEEAKYFRDIYDKSNFELDPFKPGEGPYQVLERMDQAGKIDMTEDEIVRESRRIAERDAKDMGRQIYKSTDHVKMYTEKEIDQNVKAMVDKVKGVDVSNWQRNIDWKQVKNAGYEFAFMKATEGVTYVDAYFNQNRQGARDAGLKTGYYHYFHPENSVEEQVKHFSRVVGKAEPDSLRLVIDAEDPSAWRRYPLEQRVKMVDDFLKGVQRELGQVPKVSIYCSPNFANEILGNSPVLSKYSLWIANYGVANPTLPKPWSKWDFWQFTDTGRVPGINGNADINVFNGTDLSQDQFKAPEKK